MFKFRDDNRADGVNKSHVERLVRSIASRNMLEYKPIDVNDKMEIIDGQHRLRAAERLGVEIYYRIIADSQISDVIILNVAKTWLTGDYMNYYLKNHYPEYLKLNDFMKKNGLSLKVALALVIGYGHENYSKFKDGKLIFENDGLDTSLEICQATVGFVKKMNGTCQFTNAVKFWRPLTKIVRDPNFTLEKWQKNLSKLVQRVVAKATEKDYCELFEYIHNYNNSSKVTISSNEFSSRSSED
jgi:hypothetical protein